MKYFFKKIINSAIGIIVKILKSFNYGRYILETLSSEIFSIKENIETDGIKLTFFVPNRLNKFRVDSFFDKEPETLDWIRSFKNNKIFYDIGANIGLYSCYAAKTRNCKVFSFEPSVLNLDILAKNVSINNLNSLITLIPMPLSDKTQIAEFNMSSIKKGGALSTFGENYTHDGSTMDIKFSYNTLGTSLDYLNKIFELPKPNYMKIDVDGLEHLIIDGSNEILNTVDSILIEVNDEFKIQKTKIESKLNLKGFKLKYKTHSELIENSPVKNIFNQIWEK